MTTHHHEETRMDDDIETITDRAAIRDSDEADELTPGERLLRAIFSNDHERTVAALDLDAIRGRAEAATPGPWEAFSRGDPSGPFGVCSELAGDLDVDVYEGSTREDAEFIAHAREDVPALAAEVERLNLNLSVTAAQRDEARHLLRLRSGALARVTREAEALRVALSDFAIHGTRHDLNPTHRSGDEAFWHRYIGRMDESVQDRARAALATTGEGKTWGGLVESASNCAYCAAAPEAGPCSLHRIWRTSDDRA